MILNGTRFIVIIFMLDVFTDCQNFQSELGISSVLRRIEKREADEREFHNGRFYPPISPEERCGVAHELQKRSSSSDGTLSRKKRAVIGWPIRSKFVSEIYYAIPLIAPNPRVIVPIAFGLPFAFDIPNSTDIVRYKQRSIQDRYNIYGTVEGVLKKIGFDGKTCVQRAICERSEHQFLTHGFISEIINLILSVTSKAPEGIMYDYIEAEKQGKLGGNCQERYWKCPFSIFTLLGAS